MNVTWINILKTEIMIEIRLIGSTKAKTKTIPQNFQMSLSLFFYYCRSPTCMIICKHEGFTSPIDRARHLECILIVCKSSYIICIPTMLPA